MRLAELSLTGATLALAGAALYLTTLVVAERGRADAAAEQRQNLEVRVNALERARSQNLQPASLGKSVAPGTSAGASAHTATPVSSSTETPRRFVPAAGPTLQEQLARFADPATRAVMLRIRQEWESRNNPGIRQELQLSPEEEDKLFALFGEQDLRDEEQEIRAALAGRRYTPTMELDDDIEKKLGELLGDERMKRWHAYDDTLPERRSVVDLRSRLGDIPLSETAAQQLGEAMRDERARFAAETRQLVGASSYNDAYPESARLNSEDLAARVKFREEQIARTVEYYARIRERAAAFLSVGQLQRLEDLQESNIANLRANLLRGRKVEEEMSKLRATPPADR